MAAMGERERAEVRRQLARLLESPLFNNSRRYPPLLRFIVEEALEGRGDLLKERLIGIRVFDRPANYDTASDPIVRVTIAEVRKRIAQYYHNEEHDSEIRIELMPGRYAPEFRTRRDGLLEHRDYAVPVFEVDTQPPPAPPIHPAAPAPAPLTILPAPAASLPANHRPVWKRPALWAPALAFAVLLAAVLGLRWNRGNPLDEFWGPIISTHRTVLFCLPTDVGKKSPPAIAALPSVVRPGPTFLDHETLGENVVYSDVLATLKVANVLTANHVDYRVRLNVATSLDDLRHDPAILVGGLDNPWTLRALGNLPYRFAGSDDDSYWIASTADPMNKRWSLDLKQPYASVTRDYALIARIHNRQTGQPEIVIAGIGMSGTAAAGEMLGDEQRIAELRKRVGAGFKDRDFEAVISTDVVNGAAGSPTILAVAVW